MSQYNLNRISKPRRVAVVGASEKAGTIGNALMKKLGFEIKRESDTGDYELVIQFERNQG